MLMYNNGFNKYFLGASCGLDAEPGVGQDTALRLLTTQWGRWTLFKGSTPTLVCGNRSFPDAEVCEGGQQEAQMERNGRPASARIAGSAEVRAEKVPVGREHRSAGLGRG